MRGTKRLKSRQRWGATWALQGFVPLVDSHHIWLQKPILAGHKPGFGFAFGFGFQGAA